ncbi:MAG TPA: glycoside hydrolase, partial [Terriglobales bacterium]|nr:glycoside hydrolase [Terriglobales bacterium]
PDIIFGAGRTEVSKYHWSTGQVQNVTPIPLRSGQYRADRTEPVMFSPLDPHTLYYAANVLFKTTDGGHSWQTVSPDLSRQNPGTPASVGKLVNPKAGEQRGVIYSLAPSFTNVNTIWAGTDDGQIWITRDGGKNWSNVTPPELTPWSKVTQLEASHFDDQTAYASVSRFRINDLKPYVFRSHDGGKSWDLITTGLPDNAPADTVREDPVRKGLLFCGTETGVYVSFDDGSHWQTLQLNLPHTSMRDLWIHDADLIVATHGRSFWILDDITPLRQLTPEVAGSGVHLFQPAPAYRVRRSTYTDTPLPPDEPAGQNPPNGAIIDYFLAQPASGAVTLEILDAQGKVVRRYASTDKPEPTEEELKKQLIPLYWIRMPQVLSAAAGARRWVWNLHYDTPLATHYSYPISAVPHDTPRVPQGPRALPGQYTVRLTVDGQSYTAPLTVKMDPRVKTPPAGLEQQFQMETRLASMMTQAAEAVLQARSAGEQLHTLTARASGQAKNAITVFENKLNGVLGKSGESSAAATELTLTRVNGDVVSLYGDVDRGDAAPTEAQTNAMAETEGNFASVMQRWNALKNTDLAALNRQLRGSGLPTLQLRTTAADEGGEEE